MSNLIVHGGTPLRGRITPSANKNAVLPVLCATLLTRAPLRLVGVPDITDVRKILDIFRTLGSQVHMDHEGGVLTLHHEHTAFDAARHRLPEEMRSSIMLVPPLLARFGVARLEDNVKGCTLGVREIDPHVEVVVEEVVVRAIATILAAKDLGAGRRAQGRRRLRTRRCRLLLSKRGLDERDRKRANQ